MHKTARKILEYIESHPKCTFGDVEKHIGEIYEESVYFQQVNKNGYLRNANSCGIYSLNNPPETLLVLSNKGKIALDENRHLLSRMWEERLLRLVPIIISLATLVRAYWSELTTLWQSIRPTP